jgi:hypothetical protein
VTFARSVSWDQRRAPTLLCSQSSPEIAVGCHESCQHRSHEISRINRLPRLATENLRVIDEVSVDRRCHANEGLHDVIADGPVRPSGGKVERPVSADDQKSGLGNFDHQFADIYAFEQAVERFRSVLQAIDNGFTVPQFALADPLNQLAPALLPSRHEV